MGQTIKLGEHMLRKRMGNKTMIHYKLNEIETE